MKTDTLMTAVMALIGGGGLVAIVQAVAGRRKNNSEVTDINVKTAIELERVAMERYNDTAKRMEAAEQLLAELRLEQELNRSYINVLTDLLHKNGIPVPDKRKESEG